MHSLKLLKKKKEEISRKSGGISPQPPSPPPRKILKVKTKICAIWGILEPNLKKSSTLKFMTNISFVPLICITRSIISIFRGEKVYLSIFSHRKYAFPRLLIFISPRILVSVRNSRLWRCPSREQQTGVRALFPFEALLGPAIPVTENLVFPCLALYTQRWDWLIWCQYTVTGWDSKLDLQLLSQCGSTYTNLSRSVPETY